MPDFTVTISTDPNESQRSASPRRIRSVIGGGGKKKRKSKSEGGAELRVEVGDAYIRDLPERDD